MTGNRTLIVGEILSVEALRYTPGGVPSVRAVLRHASQQSEAGAPRRTEFDLAAVAFGAAAGELALRRPGEAVCIEGFLAPRSKGSPVLELHVNVISNPNQEV